MARRNRYTLLEELKGELAKNKEYSPTPYFKDLADKNMLWTDARHQMLVGLEREGKILIHEEKELQQHKTRLIEIL